MQALQRRLDIALAACAEAGALAVAMQTPPGASTDVSAASPAAGSGRWCSTPQQSM